ncbi:unnamed protein product [Ixodes pacificus]
MAQVISSGCLGATGRMCLVAFSGKIVASSSQIFPTSARRHGPGWGTHVKKRQHFGGCREQGRGIVGRLRMFRLVIAIGRGLSDRAMGWCSLCCGGGLPQRGGCARLWRRRRRLMQETMIAPSLNRAIKMMLLAAGSARQDTMVEQTEDL